ncbi:MAG: hypothetical protein U1E17_04685 [Geminicoccaceae bacterium]
MTAAFRLRSWDAAARHGGAEKEACERADNGDIHIAGLACAAFHAASMARFARSANLFPCCPSLFLQAYKLAVGSSQVLPVNIIPKPWKAGAKVLNAKRSKHLVRLHRQYLPLAPGRGVAAAGGGGGRVVVEVDSAGISDRGAG